MPTPFFGAIPDDCLYDPAHDMWLRKLGGDVLHIGASAFGVHLAGEVIAFTSKPRNATVLRGRGMGTIECRKTVLAVHAPISFILLQGNDDAEEHPAHINLDPYGKGWMAQVKASAWAQESALLLDAPAYRRHILHLDPEARFV